MLRNPPSLVAYTEMWSATSRKEQPFYIDWPLTGNR